MINKTYSVLGILLMFMMFSFVSAEMTHKQNTNLIFSITSNFADQCVLTTINTPTDVLFVNQNGTKNSQTFNFTISSGNFTELGNYRLNIECADSTDKVTEYESVEVTYTGEVMTTQQGMVYVIALVALTLFALGLWFMYSRINTEHERNENGTIRLINYKGIFKPLLLSAVWIIIVVSVFIISNLGLAFLPNPMIGNLFFVFYRILFILTIVAVPVIFIYTLVKAIKSSEIQSMIDRGVDVNNF